MTQLKTLGGLKLEDTAFTRPLPLLLLGYLSLEGSQQRKHLAELFWTDGKRMKNLSMTLTRLRQGAGEVIEADDKQARATLKSDAQELLESLDKSEWQRASELYTGAFLEGVVLEDWSNELEEWVYSTREYLAERVQYALLNLAEAAAKEQEFDKVRDLSERAYNLPGLSGTELTNLKRLYPLLCAGRSLLAPEVRKELEEYGVGIQLTIEEARAIFKPTPAVATTTTLPVRGTSFVGRDEELTELATLLSKPNVLLLTLLGPAGVGKTRLALQIAHEQLILGAFKDGVYFAPLDALNDTHLIIPSLLNHLGLVQQGNTEPLEQLINFIADKHILLVLDNFEHLTQGSSLLSELLSKCPNLKLLITSRERLRLEEEHIYALEGLAYPERVSEDAQLTDAVELFRERAQQMQARFDTGQNLAEVIRICKVVEGLPLGIELAASWVRLMSCAEIATEIERGLELFTSASTNVPERHRSLKAAFEQSWKLLTAKEQEVLRSLSVFVGGFRREAAGEVAGATIPVLASLVDKSLLKVLPNGRYDRHPLLYQFTREKLAENCDEQTKVEFKHSLFYQRLLGEQEQMIWQGKQKEAFLTLQEEWPNIRLILERSTNDLEHIVRWVDLMDTFYDLRSAYDEALEFLTRIERRLDESVPEQVEVLGRVLLEKGYCIVFQGEFAESVIAEAEESVQRGLKLIPEPKREWRVRGLNTLGLIAHFGSSDLAKAKAFYEQALKLARECRYEVYTAHLVGNLGIVATMQADYLQSEHYHLESLALYKRLGIVNGYIREHFNLGKNYKACGQLEKARVIFETGKMLAQDIDYKRFSSVFDHELSALEKSESL